MKRVIDVYNAIDAFAPYDRAEDWDGKVVLTGDKRAKVDRCLVALDLTKSVISEAAGKGAQLIVTHHPIFFDEADEAASLLLAELLSEKGIAHISAHTNLDNAAGGVDDTLAQVLGLKEARPLFVGANERGFQLPCGRIGVLEESMEPREFVLRIKGALGCDFVRFAKGDRDVKRVATCAGAGSSFLRYAIEQGADAFVSGDLKHSAMLAAENFGVTVVDAGHYATERIVVEPLCGALARLCPGVEFAAAESKGVLVEVL